MEQQKEKTGPKGPRNKVKQVLLIEGHLDSVFYDKEVEVFYQAENKKTGV